MIRITIVIIFLVYSVINTKCSRSSYNDKTDHLMLTPLIDRGEAKLARSLSRNEPSILKNLESYSGYITANQSVDWNLFFWYFPNKRNLTQQAPWILWLQGGPGMSSLYGLFKEIGPLQIVNGKVEEMPVTWASEYSLLFIDNPAGSGFSFSGSGRYPKSQEEIGESLLNFMKQFIQVFPELSEAPLYIAGEEYGGKYVTALAHYIHHDENSSQILNLKGLIIGDGWLDPPNLLHYSEWALQQGFVDQNQAQLIREVENKARKYWDEGNVYHYSGNAKKAYNILKTFAPFDDQNFLKDLPENWETDIMVFLNQKKIKKLLHVGVIGFDLIHYKVQTKIYNEIYLTVKPWLEELLEHYGVLCYSGQQDMLMAYALLAESYRNFEWSGREAYIKARREPIFDSDNTIRGYLKTAGNFMEVMIRGAGQHVPTDKPKIAKGIIDSFIQKFM
ncbi:unnamed protein product, partial [Iphiclides podalirius]